MIAGDTGITTSRKNCRLLHPSIWAAASSSSGIVVWKKVRAMIIRYTDTAGSSTIGQMVSYKPSLRTSR